MNFHDLLAGGGGEGSGFLGQFGKLDDESKKISAAFRTFGRAITEQSIIRKIYLCLFQRLGSNFSLSSSWRFNIWDKAPLLVAALEKEIPSLLADCRPKLDEFPIAVGAEGAAGAAAIPGRRRCRKYVASSWGACNTKRLRSMWCCTEGRTSCWYPVPGKCEF